MPAKPTEDAGQAPQGVRDYIEAMLDELADLAGRSGELKIATALRHAALDVSRLASDD